MLVRRRFSTRNPGQVTGYSVALPQDTTKTGEPVWYGGGKLAADLTLPKLRRRWADVDPSLGAGPAGAELTGHERTAIWEHAARTAADAAGQIRQLTAAGDRDGAADAAWAAGDTLHAAAAALGSRIVRDAATAYDRAARVPYGRLPRRTSAGTSLRRAARLLSAAGYAGHDRTLAHAALVTRLAGLAEAVSELRMAQQHRAQAAAARNAAMYLRGRDGSSTESAVRMPRQSGQRAPSQAKRFPGHRVPLRRHRRVAGRRGGRPPGGWPRPATRRPGAPGHEERRRPRRQKGGRAWNRPTTQTRWKKRSVTGPSVSPSLRLSLPRWPRSSSSAGRWSRHGRPSSVTSGPGGSSMTRSDCCSGKPGSAGRRRTTRSGSPRPDSSRPPGPGPEPPRTPTPIRPRRQPCASARTSSVTLHPYAMARYDRLRHDGLAPLDAMRETAPLFARAPDARVGDPAPARFAVGADASPDLRTMGDEVPGEHPESDPGEVERDAAELRGQEIIERIQARALAADRPALGPDELAMILEAVTNLPEDVIDKLTRHAATETGTRSAERHATLAGLSRRSITAIPRTDERNAGLTSAQHDSGLADTSQASIGRSPLNWPPRTSPSRQPTASRQLPRAREDQACPVRVAAPNIAKRSGPRA